jgi:O-acetyl-ADP-ribose deacetylase (regulator of RNase III)
MLGFEVMPNDTVPDARISSKAKGKFLIEYNPLQYPSRINFSLAHEIGHSLFSDCAETIRYRSKEMEDNSWELEFLCNVAAAEILLPYARFSKDANNASLTIDSLKELAEMYKASLECVFIRFCEVLEKPCMIMLCRFNAKNELELDYMLKSDSCGLDEIKGTYILPKDSKVYECIKSGWTSHGVEQWNIFKGQKYLVQAIGLPALRKQREPRVGILITPEHIEQTTKRSIYSVSGDATEPRGNGNKIIAQVVNTSAGVGFGFGRAMAKKYPASKKALDEWKGNKTDFILGESQLKKLTDDVYVFQMVAQQGIFPKYGEVPLKYSSLHKCLIDLAKAAKHLNASVHMPLIGAGQAKGDWEIIQGMIFQELTKKDIQVTVYVLPGSKPEKTQSRTPQLFE